MTNLFDQYIESILESNSFVDLPDEPPYGFWISPGGDFFVVGYQEHKSVAEDIVRQNANLNAEFGHLLDKPNVNMTHYIASKKYIRVAKAFGKEYFADFFYTNVDTIPVFFYDDSTPETISFEPTNASLRTLNDIAEFYGLKITVHKN
jgi:hypothetical protein